MTQWTAPETPLKLEALRVPVAVVAVFAILLGLLGVCSGGGAVVGAMTPPQPPQGGAEVLEAFEAMVQSMRWLWVLTGVVGGFNFAASMALLLGGILALARSPAWRKVLVGALVASIVVDLCKGGLVVANGLTADEIAAYTEVLLQASMGGTPGSDAAVQRGLSRGMQIGMALGVVFSALWLVAKLTFYGLSLWVTRRPSGS